MRPLRYAIHVTLDGCCHHEAGVPPDEESMRYWTVLSGDVAGEVRRLKDEPGRGLFVGGVTLPLALADVGLIDEYEFVVQPVVAGHGPRLLDGLHQRLDLELVDQRRFGSGAVVLRYRALSGPRL